MPIPVPSVDANVAAAEGLVRRFCKWHIGPSLTEVVVVDGSGAAVQMLPTLMLTDVVAATSDGTTLNVATDFDWSANGYLEMVDGVWSRRLRGVTATITHGYDVMPDEVQALIDRLAQRILDDPGMVVQAGQVRYGASGPIAPTGVLTDDDRRVLRPYRLPGTP